MALGRLSVVLDANIAKFESDMGRAARIAQTQSRQMQQSFERAGKAIGLALGAGIATLAVSIKKSTDDMLKLSILSKQVGMPVEQFTALAGAARRADLDVQSFAAAMMKADKALTEAQSGKGAAASAFKALGIDPKQVKDNNDLILKAADSLSKYKDGIGKTAVEMAIFGRSGAQLNAFLDQGAASIQDQTERMKELGITFGPDAQQKLAQYDNIQKDFADTITGLRNKLAIALLPAVTEITTKLRDFVGSLDKDAVAAFADKVLGLGGAFTSVAQNIRDGYTAIQAFGKWMAFKQTGVIDTDAPLRDQESQFNALLSKQETLQNRFNATNNAFVKSQLDAVNAQIRQAQDAFKAMETLRHPGGAASGLPENKVLTGADVPDWMKAGLPLNGDRQTLNFDLNAGTTGKSKAVKAAEDFTKALRDQVLQLQMSGKAFEMYQLAARGANDADLKAASSLIDVRDALQKQAAAQRELTDFVAQHQAAILGVTDAELQFRNTMDTATKALNAHLVSWEQFSRIAAKAVENMNGKVGDSFDQMSEFAKQAARNMQNTFADFLFDPFKDGINGMLGDFADALRKMATQALAARVFDSIGAWGKQNEGGGGLAGIASFAAGLFGGGRAAGGPVSAGGMYQVNENGPELLSVGGRDFLMMGNAGGNVTPRGKFGAGVTNNFYTSVQPTSSQRTAAQVATAIARKQRLAMARS